MKNFILMILMAFSSWCQAANIGEILWSSDAERMRYANGRPDLLLEHATIGAKPKYDTPIGVIDSGLQSNHPQLSAFIKESKDFTGEGPEDELGHGTAVALIAIFGSNRGDFLPVPVISAKVVKRDGTINEDQLIEAINWISSRGVKVVNLSLGFKGTRDEHEKLCTAISRNTDVFFTAAAGNSGPNVAYYPAACGVNNLISVGALNSSGKIADYSGKGALNAPGSADFLPEWRYYYNLAQERNRAGYLAEARKLYERSIQIKPNAESEFQIGLIDLTEDAPAKAILRFKKSIQLNPGLAEAHEMLGASLFIQKDYPQAEGNFRNALGLYPDDPRATYARARCHFNLGQTLLQLNRRQEGRAEFEEVKRLMPTYPHIDEALKASS